MIGLSCHDSYISGALDLDHPIDESRARRRSRQLERPGSGRNMPACVEFPPSSSLHDAMQEAAQRARADDGRGRRRRWPHTYVRMADWRPEVVVASCQPAQQGVDGIYVFNFFCNNHIYADSQIQRQFHSSVSIMSKEYNLQQNYCRLYSLNVYHVLS